MNPGTTIYGTARAPLHEALDACPWFPSALDPGPVLAGAASLDDLAAEVRATQLFAPFSLRYALLAYDSWAAADEAARLVERRTLPPRAVASLDALTRAGLDHLHPEVDQGLKATRPEPPSYGGEVETILRGAVEDAATAVGAAAAVGLAGILTVFALVSLLRK